MSLFILRDPEPRFPLENSSEDIFLPQALSFLINRPHLHVREGEIVQKKEKNIGFEVNVDVQQFKPDEITVKVVDNSLIVEAKHEERRDQHGFVSRQFQRRYILPDDCDLNKIASNLSSDGILTLTAPKIQAVESTERIIPIIRSGPHKQQSKVEQNNPEQKATTPMEA